MVIWIVNIFLLFFYSLVINNKTGLIIKKKSNLLIGIMFIQLLFLYVFKDNTVFPDIGAYIDNFNFSKNINWNNIQQKLPFEFGWNYYTKFLSSISENDAILIFTTGLIILIGFFYSIKKYSNVQWFSIFLFISAVFYNSFFILRQYLAAAICLFSIQFIINRKLCKFLLIIFVAFLFHKSAIIFILLYFLFPLKINKKYFLFMILLVIIIYIVSLHLEVINPFLSMISLDEYQRNYLDIRASSANIILILISMLEVIFVYFFSHNMTKLNDQDKLFFDMLILILIINIFEYVLPGTISRLNIYFSPAIFILLPNVCYKIKDPLFKYISILSISILYFILMINNMSYGFNLIF